MTETTTPHTITAANGTKVILEIISWDCGCVDIRLVDAEGACDEHGGATVKGFDFDNAFIGRVKPHPEE